VTTTGRCRNGHRRGSAAGDRHDRHVLRTSVVTKNTTSLIGGTTAEWIVERDTNAVTGIPNTLANYVSMDMRLAAARQGTKLFWYSGVPSVPGATDLRSVNVTMTNAGGTRCRPSQRGTPTR
jgi:hypothetical protein